MVIVKRLLNPTEEELARIVDISMRSFEGTAPTRALLGGNWSLHAEMRAAQTRAVALEGELYVGILESSGRIVATSSWFPPGKSMFGTEAQRALGYNKFMCKIKEETKRWEREVLSKILDRDVWPLFGEKEVSKRWWCYNLATDPDYRHHGYATALMQVLSDKADELGHILGLIATTDENVRFYRGIGYCERGSTHVPAPTGGFDIHVMCRD